VVAAAPAMEHCAPADISASRPAPVGCPFHVRQHRREVCPLSRGVMLQPLSAPLQHGIRFLPPPLPAAPSARLATRVPSAPWYAGREDNRFTTFRQCNRVDRPYLYAGGATSAPEEFEAPGPGHLPFWSKRVSSLRLFLVTTPTMLYLG